MNPTSPKRLMFKLLPIDGAENVGGPLVTKVPAAAGKTSNVWINVVNASNGANSNDGNNTNCQCDYCTCIDLPSDLDLSNEELDCMVSG